MEALLESVTNPFWKCILESLIHIHSMIKMKNVEDLGPVISYHYDIIKT